MKIAIFTDQFYPELSGVADCVRTSALALAALGHKIDIYAPKYDRKDFLKSKVSEDEIDLGNNVCIHRMFSFPFPGSPTGQARLVIPSLFRVYFIRKEKPDIIHTHLFAGSGIQSIITSRILGIPVVGTNHTRIQYYIPTLPFGQKTFITLARRFMSGFYNFCVFVSTPAEFLLSEMTENGLRSPHAVISNAIDTDLFRPSLEKVSLRKRFGLTKKTLFYAGRLAVEKNVETLISALRIVRESGIDAELILAGHGAHEESLRKMVRELSLEPYIRFLGNLDKPELANYYQAADIYATASPSEIQSLSLMQALSTGLPSVSLHFEKPPAYLKNDVNAFCLSKDNPQDFADTIKLLVEDGARYAQMSSEALETSREFSTEYIAKQWEQIYDSYIKKVPNLAVRDEVA